MTSLHRKSETLSSTRRLCSSLGSRTAWLMIPALFIGLTAVPAAAQDTEPERSRMLVVMNADGTDLRQLVSVPEFAAFGSPNWTADGKRIAFDAWRAGESNRDARVFTVNADGTDLRDLGPGAMPSWSPGAKRIAFSQYSPNQGVWTMNADGSDRTLIDRSGWSAQWSPDGRKIAYVLYADGPNICVYDLIEGDRTKVFEAGDHNYRQIFWNFLWSPDSRRLAFKGQRADGTQEIAIVSAEGARQEFSVRRTGPVNPAIGWRPDGRQIVIAFRCPERKKQQLFGLDPDADDAPVLLDGQDPDRDNVDPAWSRDGKRIAFSVR